MKLIYLSFITLCLPLLLLAQGITCEDARWINSTASQHLNFNVSSSETKEGQISSIWLQFQPTVPGILAFALTPDIATDDLDFTLYQLNKPGDCMDMIPVREMRAGPRIGDEAYLSEPCIGSTGLRSNEADTESPSGCPDGTNNYLAALNTQAGDIFALHISNHSSSQGFSLDFTSDIVLADKIFTFSNIPIKAYPNPSDDDFQLEFLMPKSGKATVYAYSAQGQRVYEQAHDLNAGQHNIVIPATHWASGLYWLGVMVDGERREVKVEKV